MGCTPTLRATLIPSAVSVKKHCLLPWKGTRRRGALEKWRRLHAPLASSRVRTPDKNSPSEFRSTNRDAGRPARKRRCHKKPDAHGFLAPQARERRLRRCLLHLFTASTSSVSATLFLFPCQMAFSTASIKLSRWPNRSGWAGRGWPFPFRPNRRTTISWKGADGNSPKAPLPGSSSRAFNSLQWPPTCFKPREAGPLARSPFAMSIFCGVVL